MIRFNQISILYLIVILLYGCDHSYKSGKEFDGTEALQVVITGKILNPFEDHNTVSVILNDPSTAKQISFTDYINSEDSTFQIRFERYLPQDVMIKYGNIFPVFIHPGDSLHVEFDTRHLDYRPLLYDNIKFSGEPAKFNRLLAIYFSYFFHNQPDFYKLYEFQQTCTPEEIVQVRDSIRQSHLNYLEEFKNRYNPSDELIAFIKYDIEMDYANNLAMYPVYFAMANKLDQFEVVPLSFYDFLNIELPIESLINTNASSHFINRYNFGYVMPRLQKKLKDERAIIDTIINGKPEVTSHINYDSAMINYTIEITKDPLLLQLSLCEFFSQKLQRMEIDHFDTFRPIFNQYVTEPYLREPLLDYYNQVKLQIQNPEIAYKAVIRNLKNTPAETIFDQILTENKGKVIFLDAWAVWCGPCRAEMPRSKELMKKFDENEIVFAYLCIDSEEIGWKALLSELQLEGMQYYADKDQSAYLRKELSISGVPYYFLIDKKGIIVESGTYLRPGNEETFEKIKALLSQE